VPRERGQAGRVVIRANSVDNADFLEQEVKRIIEPGEIDVTYEHSIEIEIPSDKVGLIIGSRGATIKGLQLDAKKHGAHLELIQPRERGQAGRVVIRANSSVVVDLLEAEVKRTARLIEPDDASTLSAAATAENRRRPSWLKDPSFGIVPWTKVGERFYCLVQV
jgi:predicted PilT family ATPase